MLKTAKVCCMTCQNSEKMFLGRQGPYGTEAKIYAYTCRLEGSVERTVLDPTFYRGDCGKNWVEKV